MRKVFVDATITREIELPDEFDEMIDAYAKVEDPTIDGKTRQVRFEEFWDAFGRQADNDLEDVAMDALTAFGDASCVNAVYLTLGGEPLSEW